MPAFSYTALDSAGGFVKGKVDAGSLKKANLKLQKEGFLVVNIKRERDRKLSFLNSSFGRVSRMDKIMFTRHLYTLLESGIGLDQAIQITAEQTTNLKFKQVLQDMHSRVQAGEALNTALGRHPQYFSNFFINLIKVGERSGKLDEVLLHSLEQQEQDNELVTKVRGAMIYPSVIVFAAVSIVIFMMIFVIPKITGILGEYNVELPITTRILIGVSYWLSHYGWFGIPLIAMILFVAIRLWRRNKRGREQWDGLKLRLPLIKSIVAEFNIARITRALSALLRSGVSMDQALELASSVTGNVHYKKSLAAAVGFIRKGIPLTEVMRGYPQLYPPITIRMIDVGERTGQLDKMTDRLARFYEKSVTTTLANLSTIIEPFLLLSIGLIIGFIALSILTPIWKFSETV